MKNVLSIVSIIALVVCNFGIKSELSAQGQPCTVTQEFIVNGGFENGNQSFNSGLTFAPNWSPNNYCIYDLTSNISASSGSGNHTGVPQAGNLFLAADADGCPASNIWSQQVAGLTPGVVYQFSFWAADISVPGTTDQIQVVINGANVGAAINLNAGGGVWNQYTFSYTALNNTATFSIILGTINYGDIGLDSFSLTGQTPTPIAITSTATNETCPGNCDGTATVTTAFGNAPYTVTLTSTLGTFITQSGSVPITFSSLCPGTFGVSLISSEGCQGNGSITIGAGVALDVTANSTGVTCSSMCNGEIEVFADTNDPVTFTLVDANGTTLQTVQGVSPHTFTDLCTGLYQVIVTTADGCSTTIAVTVDSCTSCEGVFNLNPITSPVQDQSCYWSTGGNSTNTVGSANFIGTTGPVPFLTKTNNAERMRVEVNGKVGIHTTAPVYDLHHVGSALFSKTNTTVPYLNYNSTNYPLIVKTDANQGLAILSNSTVNNHQDRLHIYADDNGGTPVSVVETVGSNLVFKDRTIGQITNRVSMGLDRSKGQLVMKSDWLANGAPSATPNCKLYVESNNVAFSGYPNPAGIITTNTSTFNSTWSHSYGIRSFSTGIKSVSPYQYNYGGDFYARDAYRAYGLSGISNGTYVGTLINTFNYGGFFSARNGRNNYGIYAEAANGTLSEAGHFAGNIMVNTTLYTSDANLKDGVEDLPNAMEIINQLIPVSYKFKLEEYPQMNLPEGTQYGFLSQQVQEVLPTLVQESIHPAEYSEDGQLLSEEVSFLAMNYTQIIPFLTKALQEQQQQIQELQYQLLECCHNNQIKSAENTPNSDEEFDAASLQQNAPNPFSEKTSIRYYLPENFKKAEITVYSLGGELLKTYTLTGSGNGQVDFDGNTFSSGTYIYAMIVDGVQVDSKWMTLTK